MVGGRARQVLAGLPGPAAVGIAEVAGAVSASGRQLVVLDDDPTGTQTVAGVPVLTGWEVDDLRWALDQDAPAVYVSTNTRSLPPDAAAARTREIVDALLQATGSEAHRVVLASRGDSTLRGHYPLEPDVLAAALHERAGIDVDGVILAPAYIEGGRITVGSVHWLRSGGELVPVGESEFARDRTFGYRSSDLRDYVEEKAAGRWQASEVPAITLDQVRRGGVDAVAAALRELDGGRPVVVDAACDEDLRVLALAVMRAEAAGKTFLYRVGPSFVRARAGLGAPAPLDSAAVAALGGSGPDGGHGLLAVGSHVAQTTRQLAGLRRLGGAVEVELAVPRLLDPGQRSAAVHEAVTAAAGALAGSDVVVATSREVVAGEDPASSLDIAASISAALVEVVRGVVDRQPPAWVVAKGGITSSDVATLALGIRRAWVRGPLLPGIVSLWQPEASRIGRAPFVVFAGNVGDDEALAAVVQTLRGRPPAGG